MLDPSQPVDVRGFPCRVFRDHARQATFYVLPEVPGIAFDEDGQPSVSVAVYGRQVGGRFEARGAVLTITTTLSLKPSTDAAVRAELRRWLASQNIEASAFQISAVEWLSGSVTLSLTDAVSFRGQPSLTGPNQCAFNERIAQENTGPLLDAWHHGLPNSRIVYDMQVRTATDASGAGSRFTFEGRIDLTPEALARAMATTSL